MKSDWDHRYSDDLDGDLDMFINIYRYYHTTLMVIYTDTEHRHIFKSTCYEKILTHMHIGMHQHTIDLHSSTQLDSFNGMTHFVPFAGWPNLASPSLASVFQGFLSTRAMGTWGAAGLEVWTRDAEAARRPVDRRAVEGAASSKIGSTFII